MTAKPSKKRSPSKEATASTSESQLKTTEEEAQPQQETMRIGLRPELVINWFDVMRMTRRSNADGGIVIFSFAHVMPEPTKEIAGAEIARLATSPTHTKEMIDVMCKSMDYYPDKPTDGAT